MVPLTFDEDYFINGIGYRNYSNYPHFKQRAEWIRDNLSGSILEVGCAAGYLIFEAYKLGIAISGIDKSKYIVDQSPSEIVSQIVLGDVVNIDSELHFDWIISWNLLDCLDDDIHAENVADVLNSIGSNQLHVLCMSGQKYADEGYLIRDYVYWHGLLPEAHLVSFENKKVYNSSFSKIPLCWGQVTE